MLHVKNLSRPFSLGAGLAACLAAPFLMAAPFSGFGGGDETVITVQGAGDAQASVVKIPDMKVGESRTVTAENGKAVTVTRSEEGYEIRVGEKTFNVHLLGGDGHVFICNDGKAGGSEAFSQAFVTAVGDKRMVFSTKGFGYGHRKLDDAALSDLLDKQDLRALRGADRRTRDTVIEALKELSENGAVFVTGGSGAAPIWISEDGKNAPGDKVIIRMTREKDEEK